jgi:hypothetical protein
VPPRAYRELCADFLAGLRAALGDTLTSLFLYGAVTFPRPVDWLLDVDFHALLSRPPTGEQRDAVARLHRRVAEESPLGEELDGYYVLLADAAKTTPPTSLAGAFPSTGPALVTGPVDEAWALHRAHVLAGRVVVLHGTDPRTVVPAPTWPELVDGLGSELEFVEDHPEHAAFGVLNACRIAWSCAHRDVVVSKWASATWAVQQEPRWRAGIEAGVRHYTQTSAAGDAELLTAIRSEVAARARAALGDAAG